MPKFLLDKVYIYGIIYTGKMQRNILPEAKKQLR